MACDVRRYINSANQTKPDSQRGCSRVGGGGLSDEWPVWTFFVQFLPSHVNTATSVSRTQSNTSWYCLLNTVIFEFDFEVILALKIGPRKLQAQPNWQNYCENSFSSPLTSWRELVCFVVSFLLSLSVVSCLFCNLKTTQVRPIRPNRPSLAKGLPPHFRHRRMNQSEKRHCSDCSAGIVMALGRLGHKSLQTTNAT